MVYTVTLNPSVDYLVQINDFKNGCVNRVSSEKMVVGGKGINVALVLKELGVNVVAGGFVGGFTGEFVQSELIKLGLKTDFVRLNSGNTRINTKINSEKETQINALGPTVTNVDLDSLIRNIKEVSQDLEFLVLSGSVANGLCDDVYEKIIQSVDSNIKIVVDSTKNSLIKTLKYKPFLIKPNKDELEEIFGVQLETNQDIIECARDLQEKGAQNVLISLGEKGAILLDPNKEVYISNGLNGEVINTVGAGDSMVAGFLSGYLIFKDFKKAFLFSVASGSAKAFSQWLPKNEFILNNFEKLNKIQYLIKTTVN